MIKIKKEIRTPIIWIGVLSVVGLIISLIAMLSPSTVGLDFDVALPIAVGMAMIIGLINSILMSYVAYKIIMMNSK